jgi:hypothetical protein
MSWGDAGAVVAAWAGRHLPLVLNIGVFKQFATQNDHKFLEITQAR